MRPNKSLQPARAKPARRLSLGVTLLEDHRQKRLFPTTLGGGATVKSSGKWRVTSRAPSLNRNVRNAHTTWRG